MPAVRQRRGSAFGGRARGDGPGPARAVRAGVPATAGIPGAAGVSPAATPAVGIPLGAAVVRLPRATATAATPAGLFGLRAAAGIHRPAASQPVVKRQFGEQLAEQQ